MSVTEYHRRAIDIRHRLRNPPNAINDRAIEMRGGHPVEPSRPFARSPLPAELFHKRCLDFFNASVAQRPDESIVPTYAIRSSMLAHAAMKMVAQAYEVSINDLLSERRAARIVRPRQIAMWLIKETTTRSLVWIGQRFNNRDHTTVLHGCRRIDEARKEDPELQAQLDQFLSALRPTMENVNAETDRADQR